LVSSENIAKRDIKIIRGIFHRGLFPVNPGGNIIAFLKDEGTAG
jgi:hypothetical protein